MSFLSSSDLRLCWPRSGIRRDHHLGSTPNVTDAQLSAIENAIRECGAYGEVGVVIENGRIAFVTVKRSFAVKDYRQTELKLEAG